jgi:SAM-dependent methyltransferase
MLTLSEWLECWAMDISPTAVECARSKLAKLGSERIQIARIEDRPWFHGPQSFDVVTCLDVLYHKRVYDWREAIRSLAEAVQPGGILIVQAAAFEVLGGEHDATVDGARRFTADPLRSALLEMGLRVELLSYRFAFLFPILLGLRWIRALRVSKSPSSNLKFAAPKFAHDWAQKWARWENQRLLSGASIPIGSSVFAVARRSLSNAVSGVRSVDSSRCSMRWPDLRNEKERGGFQ